VLKTDNISTEKRGSTRKAGKGFIGKGEKVTGPAGKKGLNGVIIFLKGRGTRI